LEHVRAILEHTQNGRTVAALAADVNDLDAMTAESSDLKKRCKRCIEEYRAKKTCGNDCTNSRLSRPKPSLAVIKKGEFRILRQPG
jgi:hypothetical protein